MPRFDTENPIRKGGWLYLWLFWHYLQEADGRGHERDRTEESQNFRSVVKPVAMVSAAVAHPSSQGAKFISSHCISGFVMENARPNVRK